MMASDTSEGVTGTVAKGSRGGGLVAPTGRTAIADTVVQKIASIAAREVSGVHALGGSTTRAIVALR
jgi:hypothetical protein